MNEELAKANNEIGRLSSVLDSNTKSLEKLIELIDFQSSHDVVDGGELGLCFVRGYVASMLNR